VDLDHVVDDELHAKEPYSLHRQAPPAQRRRRARHVYHDRGRDLGDVIEVDLVSLVGKLALVYLSVAALGAGDGDLFAVGQDPGSFNRADDRGDSQLAADDRRVGGPPPVVGHDSGGAVHDGDPVGVGHARHQDGAVLELVAVGYVLDDLRLAGGDCIPDRQPGQEHLSGLLELVLLEHVGLHL
jgi:hypothetical protein